MLLLPSKPRTEKEKPVSLRKEGRVPGVLYGPAIENRSVAVDAKELKKAYETAGENTLISLAVEKDSHVVFIHHAQRDPLSGELIHVDFYQPRLDEKIEITVPLEFAGEAPAVKDLGGTLVKSMYEVDVRALPQNIPHEIAVDVSVLKTFEDRVLVKDLVETKDFEILAEDEEVVAAVVPPEDVEGELARPIEEQVEAVAVEEKGKKEEETQQEE